MTRATVQALSGPVRNFPLLAMLLIGTSALLTACEPAAVRMEKIPLTGEVKLQYSGTAGKAVFFNLDNGSREELVFWGARGDQTVLPQRSSTNCTSLLGSGDSFGATIIDGPDWELIRLPSGNRIRLGISESDFRGLENGRCNVRLELEGGNPIDSPQFELRGEANANVCVNERKDGKITGSCVVAPANASRLHVHADLQGRPDPRIQPGTLVRCDGRQRTAER